MDRAGAAGDASGLCANAGIANARTNNAAVKIDTVRFISIFLPVAFRLFDDPFADRFSPTLMLTTCHPGWRLKPNHNMVFVSAMPAMGYTKSSASIRLAL